MDEEDNMFYIVKLTIAYNGTHFSGWQRQQGKRTVQGVIEQKLSELFCCKIEINGAGRTDKGVHAYGQVATFGVETTMPSDRFHLLINRRMPADIQIRALKLMKADFHARYSAVGKHYRYKIHHNCEKDPMLSNHVFHVEKKLDIPLMKAAAEKLTGKKDFRAFMASGSSVKNTVRRIEAIEFKETGQLLTIDFHGNGFLYNMVRIMVGLMLDVEAGRIKLQDIQGIIDRKDRQKLKYTAPPEGLYLLKVDYGEDKSEC